jgi:molecular chaperone IbpA
MTAFDLTPLFRSTIGFDRMARLLDSATTLDDSGSGYPPYNIEKCGEGSYRIVMAVAGFSESDLSVTTQEGMLVVSGTTRSSTKDITYIHRGIAGRAFERRFQLADSIKVTRASMKNGLLNIELVREIPEAMKPKNIPITSESKYSGKNPQQLIESTKR